MTSFLTDVLATAGRLEKINLHEKIVEIQREITYLNDRVKNFVDDNYIKFTSKYARDQHLVADTERLLEEMKSLQKRVDDQIKVEISGSTRELKNLSNALKESNMSLQLSNELLSLHECIKSINLFQEAKQHIEAAKLLVHMQNMLHAPNSDLNQLDIYKSITEEYCKLYHEFLNNSTNLLFEQICWSISDNHEVISLTIKDELDEMRSLIVALHYVDNLLQYLEDLSTMLMEKIIKPIIEYDCSVIVADERVFTVKILNKQNNPDYKNVLYNLGLLFKFLHQHFNIHVNDGQSFLAMMQPYLLDSLANSLTTHCISRTIPTSNADFQKFDPVIEAMEEFQSLLVKTGFITTNQLFLSEYSKKVDELFFKKYTSEVLEKARSIIKEPLHISFTYELQGTIKCPDTVSDANEFQDLNLNWSVDNATFELPKCQISVSAREILKLVRSVLDEMCHFSDTFANTLFYTCRTVFEMYTGLMPEYHCKFLESIPQHVALFHNSCMYLAHHLLTLAHEYRDKLPKSTVELNLTFLDQVTTLRNRASESMLKHMRYQRDIIIDILKESGLSALGHATKLNPSTECELRQCIRQLELLRTVWKDVLPIKIYCKAIGCITNSMVEELITRVISVEDIRADVATELQMVFSVVMSRVPSIFPDPNEIRHYVRMWEKFLQMVKVLGASMREIESGWENGEGPLARVFTASELKQLIRALFQNTERRSELLASIKGY